MEKKVKELLKNYEEQTETMEEEFEEARCLSSRDCCDICAIASCSACCDSICNG